MKSVVLTIALAAAALAGGMISPNSAEARPRWWRSYAGPPARYYEPYYAPYYAYPRYYAYPSYRYAYRYWEPGVRFYVY